jgi:C4-dicarboxylate-specific signal transduction histidine kinase/ActR/RegA family two-component response regulator
MSGHKSTHSADHTSQLDHSLPSIEGGYVFLRVSLPLAAAWGIEMFSRSAYTMGLIDGTLRDLFGLGAFTLLTVSSIFLIYLLRGATWLRWMVSMSLVLLMVAQLSDVVDELESVQAYALLARRHPLHLLFEHCIFISGCVLLMATCYAAVIDGEVRRRQLKRKRKHLEKSIAERRKVESELKEARDRLEQQVESRTAELADRNMRLAVELAERHRFEERLERKLKYEEGLAACSRTLVSGGNPKHAFDEALQHLADASSTHRAYLYVFDLDLGRRHFEPRLDAMHGPEEYPCVFSVCPSDEWAPLELGEPLTANLHGPHCDELLDALRQSGAKSVLLLPIFWDGAWRGVLGFEDFLHERDWVHHEVRILQTAGEMIGACKQRQHAEERLREAHDVLEQRVEERTLDLTIANRMLSQEIQDRNRLEKDKAALQAKLRQAQKMQAIGTLAGGIAHDFNNILASILGYTELALERLKGGDDQRRYHEEVLKAAHRAKDLTHQILLFSRQADQQKSPVFPHLIAQEVLALLDVSCPANITIRRDIVADTGPVLSDTVHMHQVLLNLCTNAQHAMKVLGGILTVTVKPFTAGAPVSMIDGELLPGDYVYIAVHDTGQGIDPAAQERIFDPFFTTKSVEEGTGMGLAIVHGIVTGMGGGIRCESKLGAGALFEVFLPIYAGPVQEVPRRPIDRLAGTERVLVVDDEPQLVELWREILEGYGYSVTGFENSVRALNIFRDDPDRFDVVLLDQTMPGMTGADVARNILAERPAMPVIIATGFSESLSPEVAKEIGLADLIYKPILGADLAAAVRKALDLAAREAAANS